MHRVDEFNCDHLGMNPIEDHFKRVSLNLFNAFEITFIKRRNGFEVREIPGTYSAWAFPLYDFRL